MKKYIPYLLFGIISACDNSSSQKKALVLPQKDTIEQPQNFFPITDFIGGQIKMIDSLQLPLTKSVTINKKIKLESISDQEFKLLAQNFLYPDINNAALKNSYKETSFADQSIPSVTLIYTSIDTKLPIQKISIFIKPDPTKNDKVSAIYIEKNFLKKDTAITQKLYWKTDKNFQVITEKQIAGKLLPAEQIKVIWDPVE